jgi:hypothetical protein
MDADDASSADMGRRPDGDDDPLALDEETVERLLAGKLPPDQAPPENAAVAALLAAMTAPPSQEELAGQVAALAELRAVTMTRAAATHLAIKPRRRRRVGLAAVAVAGALATGGVAAAATGHLPEPVRKATRSILVTVGSGEPARTVPHPASSAQRPGSGRTGQPRPPTDATVPAPGTTGAAAAASPDLKGLCRAYLAGKDAENGKKLDATRSRCWPGRPVARTRSKPPVSASSLRAPSQTTLRRRTSRKTPSRTTSSPGPLNILDRARATPRPQDPRAADGTGAPRPGWPPPARVMGSGPAPTPQLERRMPVGGQSFLDTAVSAVDTVEGR